MPQERLQKIIAAAGIASRRKAEEMIQQGLVSVNGTTVTELGTKADSEVDSIRVGEQLLKGPERHEYVALNKPRGYVTTVSDPEGRPTVMELVRSKARLYPIGRLDFNSEGLLLLTNDGALAHKLMKAASHIPKTYLVKVAGQPKEENLRRLRAGVSIAEERNPAQRVRTAPAQIRVIKEAENPWLEVTLHEGRNRQIRKMFEEVGHHVEKIRRVRYGPLELDLPPGESRILNPKEVAQLQRATEPQAAPARFQPRAEEERRRERSSERPWSEFGDRKKYGARPQRDFADREQRERRGGDERPGNLSENDRHPQFSARPRRNFRGPREESHSDRREFRPRDGQRGERPQRVFGDRERQKHGARPARDVANREAREPRGRDERRGNRSETRERSQFGNRPRRSFGGRSEESPGERREFRPRDAKHSERPQRRDDRQSKRNFARPPQGRGDGGRRSKFGRGAKPRAGGSRGPQGRNRRTP